MFNTTTKLPQNFLHNINNMLNLLHEVKAIIPNEKVVIQCLRIVRTKKYPFTIPVSELK